MSISTQISRITADKNTIRNKLIEMGIATGTDNLDVLATKISEMAYKGAVTAEVKEGETYTIPKGYHDGSGTVSGVAGGGNYSLQATKEVTPTKTEQNITADDGFYGLSSVTVNPIPDEYQDVTAVTATKDTVLAGKIYVDAEGNVITGEMVNNGAVTQKLSVLTVSYTVPKGYHDGTGTVNIELEEKTVTPTKSVQNITPTTGKVLSKVSVAAIPDNFVDPSDATALASSIKNGETAYVGVDDEGKAIKLTGTMPVRQGTSETLDSELNTSYTIPEGYHDGAGKVQVVVQTVDPVTPTKSTQAVQADVGKVLHRVQIEAIPDAYQDVTGVTATAADVLEGSKFVDSEGTVVDGGMTNNGAVAATIDGLSTMSYTIPKGYHSGTGTVTLTNAIEEALAAI